MMQVASSALSLNILLANNHFNEAVRLTPHSVLHTKMSMRMFLAGTVGVSTVDEESSCYRILSSPPSRDCCRKINAGKR
jgi:hypothetical protein